MKTHDLLTLTGLHMNLILKDDCWRMCEGFLIHKDLPFKENISITNLILRD